MIKNNTKLLYALLLLLQGYAPHATAQEHDNKEKDDLFTTMSKHKGKISVVALLIAAGIYTSYMNTGDTVKSGGDDETEEDTQQDDLGSQNSSSDSEPDKPHKDPYAQKKQPDKQKTTPQLTRKDLLTQLDTLPFLSKDFKEHVTEPTRTAFGDCFTCDKILYQLDASNMTLYQIIHNQKYSIERYDETYRVKFITEGENTITGCIELMPGAFVLPSSLKYIIYDQLPLHQVFVPYSFRSNCAPIKDGKVVCQNFVVDAKTLTVFSKRNSAPYSDVKYSLVPLASGKAYGLPCYEGTTIFQEIIA